MRLLSKRPGIRFVFLFVVVSVACSCGPEDYQASIQKFQDASSVLISSAKTILQNVNTTEQNALIEQLAFEQSPIDPQSIDARIVISQDEIAIRLKALHQLSQYTVNLANLAQNKGAASIGKNTQDVSKSLQQLSKDAGALPQFKGTIVDNSKFSGIVGAAAGVIGNVAQLIADRKARKEIEKAVKDGDQQITDLIDLIGKELDAAYERQKSALGAQSVYLYNAYKREIDKHNDPSKPSADPVVMLALADRLEAYRQRKVALETANPDPSIEAMKKAHVALVDFVNSDKDPKTLAALVKDVQSFAAEVTPLGQSTQALVSAIQ